MRFTCFLAEEVSSNTAPGEGMRIQGLSAFCLIALEKNTSSSPFLPFPINLSAEQAEIRSCTSYLYFCCYQFEKPAFPSTDSMVSSDTLLFGLKTEL